MADNLDPVIGQCKKCRKEIRESHPCVWCITCGEPISDEINLKRKYQPDSNEAYPATVTWPWQAKPINTEPVSSDALGFLRIAGWAIAVISVIGGVVLLVNTPESRYYTTDVIGLRAMYLAIGCSQIVGGLVTGVLLNVVAGIGNAVLDIWKAQQQEQ